MRILEPQMNTDRHRGDKKESGVRGQELRDPKTQTSSLLSPQMNTQMNSEKKCKPRFVA